MTTKNPSEVVDLVYSFPFFSFIFFLCGRLRWIFRKLRFERFRFQLFTIAFDKFKPNQFDTIMKDHRVHSIIKEKKNEKKLMAIACKAKTWNDWYFLNCTKDNICKAIYYFHAQHQFMKEQLLNLACFRFIFFNYNLIITFPEI